MDAYRQSRQYRQVGEERHAGDRSTSRDASSPDAHAPLSQSDALGVNSQDPDEDLEWKRHQELREKFMRGKKANEYREVDAESPSRDRQRESRSSQPSPPPPPYEGVGAGFDYADERRERRRRQEFNAYESSRVTYSEDVRPGSRERRKRDMGVAAGSVAAAEGAQSPFRSFLQRLRGGGMNGSTSYDSIGSKEDASDGAPQKGGFWTKKRICKSSWVHRF